MLSKFCSAELSDTEWHHVSLVARRPKVDETDSHTESRLPGGSYCISSVGRVSFVPLQPVDVERDPASEVAAIVASADRQEQLWQEQQLEDGDDAKVGVRQTQC